MLCPCGLITNNSNFLPKPTEKVNWDSRCLTLRCPITVKCYSVNYTVCLVVFDFFFLSKLGLLFLLTYILIDYI